MHHKGIDLLLNAIASIKQLLNKAGFSLDIYGPKRYDYYKIEKRINELDIECVVKLHDEVSGIEKEKLLLSSDLYVMTSRFEGLPMGLLEAFAYGLPCFITKGTNMKEQVEQYDAGWTCVGTENDIKGELIRIMEEKSFFPQKGSNALSLSQCYHWDKIALKFHEIVKSII